MASKSNIINTVDCKTKTYYSYNDVAESNLKATELINPMILPV